MFDEFFDVYFRDERLSDVRRHMESANVIPGVNPTDNLYISLARLCIMRTRLLDLIIDLNNRYHVRPNKSVTKISLNICPIAD